jgi:hypothetical protein
MPLYVYGPMDWDYLVTHTHHVYIWLHRSSVQIGTINDELILFKHLNTGGFLISFPEKGDQRYVKQWYELIHPGTPRQHKLWMAVSRDFTAEIKAKQRAENYRRKVTDIGE